MGGKWREPGCGTGDSPPECIGSAVHGPHRCTCPPEPGQEPEDVRTVAQIREAALFMHRNAIANREPGEEPSFEDGVSSCALSILQQLGIDLADKQEPTNE